MEERKWEELNLDCLSNVFERVGLESLIFDVPLVCKSWYKAALNPQHWRPIELDKFTLNSRATLLNIGRLKIRDVPGIIKFAIKPGARSVVLLVLPFFSTKETLVYVANECPALEYLALPPDLPDDEMSMIPSYISKWKNLKMLRLRQSSNMQKILTQVSLHCKNFVGLQITEAHICKEMASAIITLLPNIKYLRVRGAFLERENLLMILQGCKELVYFDVRHCIGFEGDGEILKLASHIPIFECEV